MRRGFTLIELAFVLAAIALLASLVGPDYYRMVLRTRTAEGRATLEAIANAEMAYYRDHGEYLPCAPSADLPPRGHKGTFDATRPGWAELGFRNEGPTFYRYEVRLDGPSYDVIANGDLDGNGVFSTFVLHGDTMKISVDKELE